MHLSIILLPAVGLIKNNSSFSFSLVHASLFSLLMSLMSWQYALPRKIHPKDDQHRRIVAKEILYPLLSNRECNWTPLVSSSFSIWSSTIFFISSVTFDGLPDPGFLDILLILLYCSMNLCTPTLVTTTSSSNSFFAIDGALSPSLQ